MQGLTPATKYGYSIYEFEIYNNSDLKLASSVEFKEMSSELYLGENTALDVVVTPDDATYQDAHILQAMSSLLFVKTIR